jgi:rare lipoprotein A
MANGRIFVDGAYTCATRLYPLDTMLRITNTLNHKFVVVKVTDRISKRFAQTRIDLSKSAFAQIASLEQGVIPISVEVVS